MTEPVRPKQQPPDEPHLFFSRGKSYPGAIAWLGFSSFWGHLWHLAASVIATEDIDARDWMEPTDPDELSAKIGRALGAAGQGTSLTEQLGEDLWIDYVADTGDDSDVSGAVAELLFRDYHLPDEDGEILAPRGRVLLFGGDTAYPVATQIEIHNRVCIPFNKVLQRVRDGEARVMLGIPGNHDWYDGLDGFGRMFRSRRGSVDPSSTRSADMRVDTSGPVGHLIDWVEAFRVGSFVAKRRALPLVGYQPMQNASYFALRLAPKLDLWAVDRQLRVVDYAQLNHFAAARDSAPHHGRVLCISDPAYTMLEPYRLGQQILTSLEVELERDAPLVLAGDTHHYCRQHFGAATHVIAGGGGAFLHPARIWRRGMAAPEAEFPGPRASLALALQVPWQIAGGRAGFVVHVAAAVVYLPLFGMQAFGRSELIAAGLVALVAAITCALLAGWRKRRTTAVAFLALLCGAWIGMLPLLLRALTAHFAGDELTEPAQALCAYLASIYPATLGFGTYLMVLTLLGLENHQAFSSLAHPGYKHFLRLRIRQDGSAVDGWAIGKVDPLDPDSPTVLVDRFSWKNPHARG